MIFIDGEAWPPSLHGTGTEDYFNAAWGFPQRRLRRPLSRHHPASSPQEHFGLWSVYRFHIEDPIRFRTSIRVTIEHGHANDQGNDYSSVAYWYQLQPSDSAPELPARRAAPAATLARARTVGRMTSAAGRPRASHDPRRRRRRRRLGDHRVASAQRRRRGTHRRATRAASRRSPTDSATPPAAWPAACDCSAATRSVSSATASPPPPTPAR